jgi:hypothetical protein
MPLVHVSTPAPEYRLQYSTWQQPCDSYATTLPKMIHHPQFLTANVSTPFLLFMVEGFDEEPTSASPLVSLSPPFYSPGMVSCSHHAMKSGRPFILIPRHACRPCLLGPTQSSLNGVTPVKPPRNQIRETAQVPQRGAGRKLLPRIADDSKFPVCFINIS